MTRLKVRWRSAPAAGAAVIAATMTLQAHDLARSESRLEVRDAEVRDSLVVDLLEFPGVDRDGNGRVSYDELDRSIAAVFAAVRQHFVLRAPEDPDRVLMTRHELLDDHTLRMEITYTFPRSVSRLDVASTFDQFAHRMDHQHVITATRSGDRQGAILDAGNRTATLDFRYWTRRRVVLTAGGSLLCLLVGSFVYQQRRSRLSRHHVTSRT